MLPHISRSTLCPIQCTGTNQTQVRSLLSYSKHVDAGRQSQGPGSMIRFAYRGKELGLGSNQSLLEHNTKENEE